MKIYVDQDGRTRILEGTLNESEHAKLFNAQGSEEVDADISQCSEASSS